LLLLSLWWIVLLWCLWWRGKSFLFHYSSAPFLRKAGKIVGDFMTRYT
jgi:hypothetical protein